MQKAEMLKEIEEALNVVNKGLFNPDDFDDSKTEEIKDIHEMVTSRNQITAIEQSAIIEELSKLRK
ncbi:DUF1128 family protein [Salinicoccus sp. ID82-1]|uniref:DUF1128 family protein n=1 Tax=Salinicoccus cyprini TaxID=2493691 RepID=A0A558ATM9_9STAP|nr:MULTISPECIES: DUF1128 family protein [Salinicoccus]MCG1010950.1 DUF1128 family protein [Salinicoccus sp. ID82-1]TVT27620.1 DUF1128 family protein [Salinicoccus cyprini]